MVLWLHPDMSMCVAARTLGCMRELLQHHIVLQLHTFVAALHCPDHIAQVDPMAKHTSSLWRQLVLLGKLSELLVAHPGAADESIVLVHSTFRTLAVDARQECPHCALQYRHGKAATFSQQLRNNAAVNALGSGSRFLQRGLGLFHVNVCLEHLLHELRLAE